MTVDIDKVSWDKRHPQIIEAKLRRLAPTGLEPGEKVYPLDEAACHVVDQVLDVFASLAPLLGHEALAIKSQFLPIVKNVMRLIREYDVLMLKIEIFVLGDT